MLRGDEINLSRRGTGDGFANPATSLAGDADILTLFQTSLLLPSASTESAKGIRVASSVPPTVVSGPGAALRTINFGKECMRAQYCADTDTACFMLRRFAATGVASIATRSYIPIIPIADPTQCVPENDALAPHTLYGLDTALRSLYRSAWVLSMELDVTLEAAPERVRIIQHVGSYDTNGGFVRAHAAIASSALSFLAVATLSESVIFITYLVSGVVFYIYLLKPFREAMQAEAARAASMLAFLPPNIDVRRLATIYNARMRANQK